MLIDGLTLIEGASVANLVVANGSNFPTLPDQGELFYLNIAQEFFPIGLYVYSGTEWTQVATSAQLNEVATAATVVTAGTTYPSPAVNGELFYKSTSDITGDVGLYVYQESDSQWHAVSSGAEITNHINDTAVHLTSTQNTWLDSIAATSTEVNYLSGVTSSIQTQLSSKLNSSGGTISGNIVVPTGVKITIADAPSNSIDAVNKAYVDSNLAGLSWKNSVKVATTANITLSGTQTIDGISVVAGDRVLVKNQTTTSQNGIYIVASGSWTRATDMDSTTPINEVNSAAVFVEQGTSQADTGWTQINLVTTLGTDAVSFTQFNGAAGITAGVGLDKSGNTLNVLLGAGIAELPTDEIGVDLLTSAGLFLTENGSTDSTATGAKLAVKLDGTSLTRSANGLKVSDGGITAAKIASSAIGSTLVGGDGAVINLATTGVTAGTATKVTVDVYGRVTSGSTLLESDIPNLSWSKITSGTPTTLAGYGITDAAPSSHVSDNTLHLTSAQNTWLDAITATSTEVNYLSGVTSAIQTQLNAKQALDADLTAIAGLTGIGVLNRNINTDAYWANTTLALNFETGTVYDEKGHSYLNNAASPAWSVTSSNYKFNSYSFYTGTGAAYTGVYFNHSTDFDLRSVDCTVESWVYIGSAISTNSLMVLGPSTSTGATSFYVTTQGAIAIGIGGVNELASASAVITRNQWYHISFNKIGSTTKIYVNGIQVASGTGNYWTNANTNFGIGGLTNTAWPGYTDTYFDDVRIVKGQAMRTGNFTVPASSFYGANWALDTSTYLTGNQTITLTGAVTGSGTTSINTTLADSGVTLGTYRSVTVNAKGIVTSGTNPITLAGYGITDALSTSLLGVANGVATLDSTGLIPSSQLPSYVDDVLEYTNLATFPVSGTSGKIYVAQDTSKIYRWSGSAYIEISPTAGNADTATKLATARSISATGDATWSVSFDGSANVSAALTLANSGVSAGTYKSVTVNAKGLVTGGTNPTTLAGYGITDAAPSSHTSDYTLHLNSAQNTWLDAITVTSAEVNYLSGVTSAIQTQLNAKQALDADLTAIAALAGTSGFLKKTAADTWALDTSTYLTSYTETDTLATVTGRGATTTTPIVINANSASDALRITQAGAGNAFVVEDSTNPDSTPFVIDTSGNLTIGYATGTYKLNVKTDSYSEAALDGVLGGYLHFRRVATSQASPTVIASGNVIGQLVFEGYDGSAYKTSATIEAIVDNTPGTNDMPGRLVFSTTADGASTPTERMRIDSSGNVGIGGAPLASTNLYITKNISGGTTAYGIALGGVIQSGVTSETYGYQTTISTSAAAFTLSSLIHYGAIQGSIGAGSAVTNQFGFLANGTLTGATNNYGFYSNIASGTGRYNFYANGTAANYFAGATTIGSMLTLPNTSAQSLTDGALWANGASGAILFDDAAQKRISWNDGSGNFNIRAGNYYNGTSVLYTKGTSDANGGAAAITLANDAVDGSISLNASVIGTPGTAVSWGNSVNITPTQMTISAGTTSTSTSTGALVVSGGAGIAGNTYVGGNLSVTGNLTINGTTTTVNSTTVTVDDPIITLGGDTAPVADDNKDRGVEFRYHNGTAAKVGFFGFDDSTGKFTFIPDATNTSEVFSGTQGTISANVLESTVATGTAPLAVTSTTVVTNLNADMLDGKHIGTSGNAIPLLDGTNTWSSKQSFTNVNTIFGTEGSSQYLEIATATNFPYLDFHSSNTAVDYNARISCGGATAGLAAGDLTFESANASFTGNISSSKVITASKGINPGAVAYPIYEANVDFGAAVANTWVKIVGASLANTTYSTVGFIIEVIDPQANHAVAASVNTVIKETYHVACVRAESTTVDTPDACYVSGPSNRIRAIKTAVGAYEIQIQNLAQYREYKIRISTYASNASHTIDYFNGTTAGTATATYTAASGASVDYFQNITVTGTILGNGVTAGSASTSFVEYNGTTKTAGQWDGGTTAPSSTTRLNYDGYLYATRFYGDGSQLTGVTAADSSKLPLTGGTLTGGLSITTTTNASIELGRVDGTSSTPFIDFHSGATATDYDARIIANGGNGTTGNGSLTIQAAGGVTINGAVISNNFTTTNGNTTSATLTTSATTANQVVMNHAIATYRSVQYQIQVTSSTSYHSTIVNVIHNGTTAYITEYGTIFTGSSLATFDADISGGNLRLLVTPTNAVSTIKVIASAINI